MGSPVDKLVGAFRGLTKPTRVRVSGLTVNAEADRIGADIRRWLYNNKYETYESGIVAEVIRPGDRVLDLGGGFGLVAMIAARAAGPSGVVRVYEPNPDLVSLIEENAAANGLPLDVRAAAVAAEGGRATFNVAEWFVASSLHDVDGARPIEVDVRAFADVVAEFRPTVLIIDVEGAERDLFDLADLSGVRAACVEVHPARIGRDGASRAIARLVDKGLAIDFNRTRKDVYFLERVTAAEGASS